MTENQNPVVAALPGAGWMAIFKDEDGLEHGDLIVGWFVHADGDCRPMVFDQHGSQDDPRTAVNFVRLQEPARR